MILVESEAKKKLCPLGKTRDFCVGSDCLAWTTIHICNTCNRLSETKLECHFNPMEIGGYCKIIEGELNDKESSRLD